MRWLLIVALSASMVRADERLKVGVAGHAFDHLATIGEQADAAIASGANVIYATGVGGLGYAGMPARAEFEKACADSAKYVKDAKSKGIGVAIGYVCATSIVKIGEFDRKWGSHGPAPEGAGLAQLRTKPGEWLQCGRDGKALTSWYGGDYSAACMSNPDWRAYEKFVVRAQLETGCDGIFFDNPTVHPEGCYCAHCMKKFGALIGMNDAPVEKLRAEAVEKPKEFLKFRSTIAAEFLAEIRDFARKIRPDALITCNNSLNSPDAFFSQCRTYGYNIFEMSKVEDLVVVEDMQTQPRVLADGRVVEYGPVYEMLRAISHGKPVVAVALADGDYHTPANLMRLAMAEAAAHECSYLWWPTWPEGQRERMVKAVRPQAEFLREHAELLNGTEVVADEVVRLDFDRWVESADCPELGKVRELAARNVQFVVTLATEVASPPKQRVIEVENGPRVRVVVRRKGEKTIVHLLNMDVQKVSSFEDRVTPASDLKLKLSVDGVKCVKALSADEEATKGRIDFAVGDNGIRMTIPKLVISTILLVE